MHRQTNKKNNLNTGGNGKQRHKIMTTQVFKAVQLNGKTIYSHKGNIVRTSKRDYKYALLFLAKKAANMMLQSAEYCKTLAGPTVFIPSIHSAKEDREENLKAITKEIAALVSVYGFYSEQGKLFDLLFNHLLADAHFNVPENVWKSLAAEYQTAPIYTDRKGNEVTLYDGLWHDGHMGKLNLIYIDEYQFTGRHADVERMERQIERRRNKKIMNA